MKLIKSGVLSEPDWIFCDDIDHARHGVGQILPHKVFLENLAKPVDTQRLVGIQIDVDTDLEDIIPYFDRLNLIVIEFASIADGRGFSTARRLRQSLNYAGEIWANGKLYVDQYPLAVQCGIDGVLVDEPLLQRQPIEHWREALDMHPAFRSLL